VRVNEAPLGIGIGINSGRAIVGSIGSSERMEFT
jgi:class 3 adenylate cyclase